MDIVSELKAMAITQGLQPTSLGKLSAAAVLDDAARRIKQIETENDRLRAALREIAEFCPGVTHGWAEHVRGVARRALAGVGT